MGTSKKIVLNCILCTASLLFLAGLTGADPSAKDPGPVYKKMRPLKPEGVDAKTPERPFDVEQIPDPFLSYLIGAGKKRAAQTEQQLRKRFQAEQKRLAEEEVLLKRRLAAKKRLMALKMPKTELQEMHIGQLILTAIVQGKNKAWAMVRNERGRGFVLKKGTHIGKNGGVVSKIVLAGKKVSIREPYLENGLYLKHKTTEMTLPDKVYE